MRPRIELLEAAIPVPHERVTPARLAIVEEEVRRIRAVVKPLVVDEETMLLVDGHHRLMVLRRLGARRVPVVFIDYARDIESVAVNLHGASTRRLEAVLGAGGSHTRGGRGVVVVRDPAVLVEELARRIYPPKTTIHDTWAKRVIWRVPLSLLY